VLLLSNLLVGFTSVMLSGLMAKIAYLDEEDRKLLSETKQKLDEATKLMGELMETIEVLSDPQMMKAIRQGLADIKAGRVKELNALLREEAH
jgi:hypothetical protein